MNQWLGMRECEVGLRQQLKKRPCKVYPSAMRVKVSPTGLYTYPDVTVLCDKARFDDEHRDTLLNPTLIIEVLSDSTEGYDPSHYTHVALQHDS